MGAHHEPYLPQIYKQLVNAYLHTTYISPVPSQELPTRRRLPVSNASAPLPLRTFRQLRCAGRTYKRFSAKRRATSAQSTAGLANSRPQSTSPKSRGSRRRLFPRFRVVGVLLLLSLPLYYLFSLLIPTIVFPHQPSPWLPLVSRSVLDPTCRAQLLFLPCGWSCCRSHTMAGNRIADLMLFRRENPYRSH